MSVVFSKKYTLLLLVIVVVLLSIFILIFLKLHNEGTTQMTVPSFTPDVQLSKKTPYGEDTFSIVSDYIDSPIGHYKFLVEIAEGVRPEDGKSDFIKWAKSEGLSEDVIRSLDIEYLEPSR
jgi:hypothetical protein